MQFTIAVLHALVEYSFTNFVKIVRNMQLTRVVLEVFVERHVSTGVT